MLFEKIHSDLVTAMKSGDTVRRDVLRFLEADVKKKAIDTGGDRNSVSDEAVLEIIARQVKQRKDSVSQFVAGGRQDLADPELGAIEILSEYLPEQLSDEAIAEVVSRCVAKMSSDGSVLDMGKVMGCVMGEVKGVADGSRVRTLVANVLGKR